MGCTESMILVGRCSVVWVVEWWNPRERSIEDCAGNPRENRNQVRSPDGFVEGVARAEKLQNIARPICMEYASRTRQGEVQALSAEAIC